MIPPGRCRCWCCYQVDQVARVAANVSGDADTAHTLATLATSAAAAAAVAAAEVRGQHRGGDGGRHQRQRPGLAAGVQEERAAALHQEAARGERALERGGRGGGGQARGGHQGHLPGQCHVGELYT